MNEAKKAKLLEKEMHEFMTNPAGFFSGFLSRRKAANAALKKALGESPQVLSELAEIAAFYNKLFNAAVSAFKRDPAEFLKQLENER